MTNRTTYAPACDCAECGCIKQFTLVAESDLEFSSVPDSPVRLTLRKGESVTFTSADHLYIRTGDPSVTDGGRDG